MLECRSQTAMLCFPGVRGIHPCVVENVHAGGACISSGSYYILFDDFELSFDGFKTSVSCHVVWRNDNRCGVRFSGRGQRAFNAYHGSWSGVLERLMLAGSRRTG